MGMRLFRALQHDAVQARRAQNLASERSTLPHSRGETPLAPERCCVSILRHMSTLTADAAGVIVNTKADIRSLTGVRGVAAVIIVIYHYGKFHLDHVNDVWAVPHGYLPVDLFFMLSGFVIGYVHRDDFHPESSTSYRTFLIKRFARLYPAYIVISGLYVLKIALGLTGEETFARFDWLDWAGNLLLLTGWGLNIYPLIGVSWASSAELGSYFVAPVLSKYTLEKDVRWWTACVVVSLGGIYLISNSGEGASGPLDVVARNSLLPLCRAIIGFTLGLATLRYATYLDRLSAITQDGLVVGILALMIALAVFTAEDLPIYLLFVPFIAILSRDGRVAQALFGNRLVYHLGLISYSIYLLHPLFLTFAERSARHLGNNMTAYVLCTLTCFAAIWLLSYLSYRFVEMPGRQFVIRLLNPKAAAATAPPAQPTEMR
jgi:peptidoglycan/LPS O-acetylase OafA/YrhL